MSFFRNGEDVSINGEAFKMSDVTSVVSSYKADSKIHYYDGKKHYKSNGKDQIGLQVPSTEIELIMANIVAMKACRKQREVDESHMEALRKARSSDGNNIKRRP
jgi:hypothetical protein